MWSLLVTAWVAGQGQALQMSYPTEPGLTRVIVRWSGHAVPFVQRGDRWLATVGVDLDSRPGDHAVDVTFSYEDGRTRVVREPVIVSAEQYPTTELKSRSATSSSAPRTKRARDARGRETSAIYATFTPERYWSEAFEIAGARREGRAQLRPSPRVQRPAAGAALGRGSARDDGHADLRGQSRPRRARQGPVLQRQRRVHRPRLWPLHDVSAPVEDRRRRRRQWSSAASCSVSRARRAA